MAATIRDQRGVEVEMIEGSKGIFDVKLDGRMIYSKYDTGRFPTDDEVLEQIPADS